MKKKKSLSNKIKKRSVSKKKIVKNKKILKKKPVQKKNTKKQSKKSPSSKSRNKKSYLNPRQFTYWVEYLKLKNNDFIENALVIPKNFHIQGNILSKKTILIFGIVDGDVQGSQIILAPGSKCSGTIKGDSITIFGNVQSEIYAKIDCLVKKSAIINGDIYYNDIINIESGAKILGSLFPKKKPLALPDYSNKNSTNNSNMIDLNFNLGDNSAQLDQSNLLNQNNNLTKSKGALDRLISKIFS